MMVDLALGEMLSLLASEIEQMLGQVLGQIPETMNLLLWAWEIEEMLSQVSGGMTEMLNWLLWMIDRSLEMMDRLLEMMDWLLTMMVIGIGKKTDVDDRSDLRASNQADAGPDNGPDVDLIIDNAGQQDAKDARSAARIGKRTDVDNGSDI